MHTVERIVLWGGMMALAIFVLGINERVRILTNTVQTHTAMLSKPELNAVVLPGIPAALATRWAKATAGQNIRSQDSLWLTLQITNTGQSNVRNLAAELTLLPAITAIYPYSEAWNTPKVAEGGPAKTQVKFTFPGLSQGEAHTVFIAVRPDDFAGPPYEAQAKRQWADNCRLYWKTLTVTAEAGTKLVQYGLESAWTVTMQHTAKQ